MLTMLTMMESSGPAMLAADAQRRALAPLTPPTPAALRELLTTFEPITLAQMANASLLDRSEIKYLLPQRLLLPVLAELRSAYRVLAVTGQPLSRYRTLYFDTDDLALYRRHHAGAPDRYKVRAREYVDSHAISCNSRQKIQRLVPTAPGTRS